MSSAPTLTPPPGSSASGPSSAPAGAGAGMSQPMASSSPATPSPQMQQAMQQALFIVQNARSLAKQFPEAAPFASQINDAVRSMMMKIAGNQQAGEPAAPPVG